MAIEEDDDLLGFNEREGEDAPEVEADDAGLAATDADEGEQDRPRDDRGRFAPVAALKAERKGRQEATSELEKLKAEIEALKRGREPQQTEPQRELSESELLRSQQLDTFEEVSRMQYGDEVVDEAQKWFQDLASSDPFTAQAIQKSRNPYKELIKRFEKHLIAEELAESGIDLTDPDAWALKRAAELQQQQRGGSQQPAPSQGRAPPPRSLVGAPSTGGANNVAVGPGQAFDDVFG